MTLVQLIFIKVPTFLAAQCYYDTAALNNILPQLKTEI